MDEQLYLVNRLRSTHLDLGTIYRDNETNASKVERTVQMIMSDANAEYLVDRIIDRSDPLRNGHSNGARPVTRLRVDQYLSAWNNLGKFSKIEIQFHGKTLDVQTVSPVALLDHYNKEFIDTFAEMILPSVDVTKVTSVVNPAGLYAQQERILRITSKPVPFYERSLYKRLHDTKLDQRIDETETPFYRMDTNPRMLDSERKKRNVSSESMPSYLDRSSLAYRMKPNY